MHVNLFVFFSFPGQETRDRYSGAVETYARRNAYGSGLHSDHSKTRHSDGVPSSKDVVIILILKSILFMHLIGSWAIVFKILVLR